MGRLQVLSALLCLLLSSCHHDSHSAGANQLKIGIVFDKGGKDDKSFNNAAYTGAMKAKGDFKVFFKYIEATDDSAYEGALRAFAHKDFNLIIAIGVSQAEAIKKVSHAFPDRHFAIVDAEVDAPNEGHFSFKSKRAVTWLARRQRLRAKQEKLVSLEEWTFL
jgi:basic membrane protein A